jgi:hypothetical protein
MRYAVLVCAVTLLLPLFRASAQKPAERVRVRIDSAPSRWVVGTVIRQDQDSLWLGVAGKATPVSLARSTVRRLEVSRGHQRAVVEGLAAGFGLGFLVGADAAGRRQAPLGCPDGLSGICAVNMEWDVIQEGVAAGAIGGLVGAAVGFTVGTERWDAAPAAF